MTVLWLGGPSKCCGSADLFFFCPAWTAPSLGPQAEPRCQSGKPTPSRLTFFFHPKLWFQPVWILDFQKGLYSGPGVAL